MWKEACHVPEFEGLILNILALWLQTVGMTKYIENYCESTVLHCFTDAQINWKKVGHESIYLWVLENVANADFSTNRLVSTEFQSHTTKSKMIHTICTCKMLHLWSSCRLCPHLLASLFFKGKGLGIYGGTFSVVHHFHACSLITLTRASQVSLDNFRFFCLPHSPYTWGEISFLPWMSVCLPNRPSRIRVRSVTPGQICK